MTDHNLLLNLVRIIKNSAEGDTISIEEVKEYALEKYDSVLTDAVATKIVETCKTLISNYDHCTKNGYPDLALSLVPGETKH